MSHQGWSIRYDDTVPSNPWTASHLADGITVHAEDETRLGAEIRFEQNRRCFNARQNANGSR
jgi:hypothetical protein